MVNCAVPGCKNDMSYGVKMNNIPKDENRRKQWIKNAGLDVEKIKKTGFICEYHFTADMWEKIRVDGKRKLKITAVPTIFGDLVTQIKYSSKKTNQTCISPSSLEPVKQVITTYDSLSNSLIIEEDDWLPSTIHQPNKQQHIEITESNSQKSLIKFFDVGKNSNKIMTLKRYHLDNDESHVKSTTENTFDDNDTMENEIDAIISPNQNENRCSTIHYPNNQQQKISKDNSQKSLIKFFDVGKNSNEIMTLKHNNFNSDDSSTIVDIIDNNTIKNQINTVISPNQNENSNLELLEYIKNLEQRLQTSEQQILILKRNQKRLENKFCYLLKKNQQIQTEVGINAIGHTLNDDQIQFMNKKYRKSPQWSNSTIKKALKLKSVCGLSGYRELCRQHYPLPSLRTLNRRLENSKYTDTEKEKQMS